MNRRKFLAMLAMLAADGCGAHRPVVPLDESVYRYGVSPPVYGRRRSEPLRIVHRPDFVTVTNQVLTGAVTLWTIRKGWLRLRPYTGGLTP